MKIETLQKVSTLVPFEQRNFSEFIDGLVYDFDDRESVKNIVLQEINASIYSSIDLKSLLEATILIAAQNIKESLNFDKLATRLQLITIYRYALKGFAGASDFNQLYVQSFKDYLNFGYENKLLNLEMRSAYSESEVAELASELRSERDEVFNFIGLDTALKRYFKLDWEQHPLETPQFMWMRVAMWMAYKEADKLAWAKKFYDRLSNLQYIPGGSTNIGAGTNYPTLSNCFILDTEDDTHHIFDNVKNVAMISKATGGIGLSVTKLRASGSPVKSNNTFSTGPIPFIKVMDSTLKSMARAGKKHGAMCIYMENWHYNFSEFLDLKQNNGDDYRRIRTADTAVYLSDEFMKRVVSGQMWYMFDPAETPDLPELYGEAFSKRYQEYCELADQGKIELFKVIPAREQMQAILTSLISTSHPWLTWKDAMNVRALNNNTGTIHSSNLCTEICLPQDRENIAVCNLAYLNLASHVKQANGKTEMDWVLLRDSTRIAMRHLDNLVDVNLLTVPEAKKSDEENRAVGLGMSGLAEVFEKFGMPYDSEQAYTLADKITEFISYTAIDESANIAQEKGAYANFQGSEWSKGLVPVDTISRLEASRGFKPSAKAPVSSPLDQIKNQIEQKLGGSNDETKKEMYDLMKLMTDYMAKVGADVPAVSTAEASADLFGTVDFKQNKTTTLDWAKLREKVKKGIRNATLMAIAPNASTGLVLGTTPGIDVRFAQVFSRATSRGKYLDINPNLVNALKDLGLWDKVKNQLIENYGDVSMIPEVPENLKEIYKTSFQVSPYGVIEVASRAQKWIDQALSRNMYLDTREIDDLIDIYTEAWKRGLKTTYYLHVKPRHSAEQSTVKVNKATSINKSGFSRAFEPKIEIDMESINKPVEVQIEIPQIQTTLSVDKVEDKVLYAACPIDPAERALCEACQ
jgi:ribonucleoside-diphosphate reductase alpha chain